MNATIPVAKAPPIKAGAYLRKRREAAGLTIDEVAAGCALPPHRAAFAVRLRAIEADQDAAADETLKLLRGAFRFDRTIYRDLLSDLPGRQICRNCACSFHDSCVGPGANCHWVEPDLCSRCASPGAVVPEPAFVLKASDPHSITVLSVLACLRLGEWNKARSALDDAIRAAGGRQRIASIAPAAIDRKGGEDLCTLALDMIGWRQVALGELDAGQMFHV